MVSIGCPNCGEDLKKPTDSCPHCKKPLPEIIQKLLLERSQEKPHQKYDKPNSSSNYILEHWRGELPLAISFWINLILLNIAILLFNWLFFQGSLIEHPVIGARLYIIFNLSKLVIVYPWQIIGLWRACTHYRAKTGRKFWPGLVEILIILGILVTLVNLTQSWQTYTAVYKLGFQKDKFSDYKIELKKDSTLIHLTGRLRFGVSEEVNELLKEQTNISGIILDSRGGRIYEGRELSKLILANGLTTYSLKGCYSACVTAFISGKKRFLATGANIAFHQYKHFDESFEAIGDIKSEQEKDLSFFKQQGIKEEFLDRIFNSSSDDLWFPAVSELVNAGVIHGVVNPSNLIPTDYQFKIEDEGIEKGLLNIPAYKTIKKYHPQIYKELIVEMREGFKSGKTDIELQAVVRKKIGEILLPALPRSSDQALIKFAAKNIKSLKKLSKINPFLCMKFVSPKEYGPLDVSKFFSKEELNARVEVLNSVIVDAYEKETPEIDVKSAEKLLDKMGLQLGEDAAYLDPASAQNRVGYKRSCDALIRVLELILTEDEKSAGNYLRWTYSEN